MTCPYVPLCLSCLHNNILCSEVLFLGFNMFHILIKNKNGEVKQDFVSISRTETSVLCPGGSNTGLLLFPSRNQSPSQTGERTEFLIWAQPKMISEEIFLTCFLQGLVLTFLLEKHGSRKQFQTLSSCLDWYFDSVILCTRLILCLVLQPKSE